MPLGKIWPTAPLNTPTMEENVINERKIFGGEEYRDESSVSSI